MFKATTSIAALALAASLAAGQSASVSLVASSGTVAPGGSVIVSLETAFDTGGAGGGLFGAAGFYGFGGTVAATGSAAADFSAGVPTLNGMLAFGPVAAGGAGASLATGAAGRGSGCPDPASHESGAAVGDDSAAIEPADHCATDDRNDPAGCAPTSARRSNSGGAVADGTLRQGSAGHQWRAGVAGVRRQAR